MTNPVNAGADTEKELAEKVGFRVNVDAESDEAWITEPSGAYVQSCDDGGPEYFVKLWAALLAEAGERKRVEAELAAQANCTAQLESNIRFLNERLAGPQEQHQQAIKDLEEVAEEANAAELRASTEAERARGLEAQLDTLRHALKNLCGIVGGSLGYAEPEMREAIGNTNIAIMELRLKEADAALSQLPTPSTEPQQT